MELYLRPISFVTIGSLEFDAVNSVVIEESVKTLGDKCTIKLPRNYRKLNGRNVLDYLKTGQRVEVQLGYNGLLLPEFTGYVREIESSLPLTIHCDDEFYPLKQNSLNRVWEKVSLKDVLGFIAPGYTIECPDVNLGKFQADNQSSFGVLKKLQEQYGFYSFVRENRLICQWAYDVRGFGQEHEYTFGSVNKPKKMPCVKANSLTYQRKEDSKVRIKAIANKDDGTKITVEMGYLDKDQQASVRTLNFGDLTESELRTAAGKELQRLVYDGYTGDITGFGAPQTRAGDSLTIYDADEPDREGKYLIESVTVTYDVGSMVFERKNTLSFKL